MSHGEIVSYKNLCNLKDHKAKKKIGKIVQNNLTYCLSAVNNPYY